MAIADKQVLIKNLETELGDVLTVTQLNAVLQTIGEQLTNFEVEQHATDEMGSMDLLDAFIGSKRVEGRSEKTLERYHYILTRLMKAVNAPMSRINVYHLRSFLAKEKERGISDNTLEGYREIFSSVFGWLHSEGLIQTNPCANLSTIKVAKKVRLPYSDVDMENLRDGCTNDRDKAIVYFLRATGCRISEVCGLDRDDVDLDRLECKVLGKGNKERTVYFDSVTAMVLRRYLASRTDDNPALFVSAKRKTRMMPGCVRYVLKEIEHASGGSLSNVHPHRFRRTMATGLINAGMPIQDVAAILGHDKIDTTMQYVYQSKDGIKSAYQRYAK